MASFVRTAWGWPRAPGAPARVWRDWVLVGGLIILTLVEATQRPQLAWLWPSVVVEVVVVWTLLWRRTHPGLMAVIGIGGQALFETVRQLAHVAPNGLYTSGFLLILFYAVVRWGSGREIMLAGALVLIGGVRSLAVGSGQLADIIGAIGVVTTTVTLGAVFRYRTAVRTERLEQARLLERERLARDLHDTVAHHVSAIAVRAQAGLATHATDPSAADDALRVIVSEARLTLREMRSIVRELRDHDAGSSTSDEASARLRALAEPRGEPVVTLHIDGDLATLPAPIATAVYRVAQESVTNARQHAPRASGVTVRVTVTAAAVRVRVHDDGQSTARASNGAGWGIVGMVERVSLLGGSCQAGPDPLGGWEVTATVPLGEGRS